MATRFFILSTQRSGSTWVVDMLDSHPRIVTYSELLNEAGAGRPRWGGAKDMPFWTTWREEQGQAACTEGVRHPQAELLWRYVDTVFRPRHGIQAVGVKLMYDQLSAKPALYQYMHERQVCVIHLIRRNLLDILVSRYLAIASDVFHTRDDAVPVPVPKRVHLDPQTLVSQLRALRREGEAFQHRLVKRGIKTRDVYYENLVQDESHFSELTRFLGVTETPGPLTSSLRKIVREPISKVIENHAEVAAVLAGTEFAALAMTP